MLRKQNFENSVRGRYKPDQMIATQVSTITTYLYPVCSFKENTGRMVAMSEAQLLTNSIISRWCNGSIAVSKTVGWGSSPYRDANAGLV